MKILLIGEYSNLHNSLKAGLEKLGHTVVIAGLNDGFKNFPVDILLKKRYQKGFFKKLKVLIYKLSKIDLYSLDIKRQIKHALPELSGFDVVQFINESAFMCTPNIEAYIFNLIQKNNSKTYLLSCGTDYTSVNYAYNKNLKYSILTPYFDKKGKKSNYQSVLKYLKPEYKKLHDTVFKGIEGVIASDFDYHLPLQNHPKYLGMIANPINVDVLEFKALTNLNPIVIFHGINKNNYYKKGNDLFEIALKEIKNTHGDKVKIITTHNLPYNEYIKAYNDAHIILDQVYSYDQGYNALESMAKGKVVFTGLENECLLHYNLEKNSIAINATPNINELIKHLNALIENPDNITKIGRAAQRFVNKEHNYINSAKRYLELWES
ncbi:glycosyltransferase [Lacinutrix sp. MedPE-SW]|uniref:glycosyltransferase n=1 Tax=Lacinutrix sp. MedPE-SW TaxID=1860087 RepID=UPI00090F22D6|nr:glycosyltransferase [Lacinutrix sp. MedPE-SW]OIQ17370.1 MAG: glycosyl transferase family 1 [Lacinutrix sp. MedPE-SW]